MIGKTIIITAVNITHGGPAVVLTQLLDEVHGYEKYSLTLFTNSSFCNSYSVPQNVNVISCDWAIKSLAHRLFFEFIYLYIWSLKHNVHVCLSANDFNPFVKAKYNIAYIHNPLVYTPYKLLRRLGFKTLFKSLSYSLYQYVFLRFNDYVVCQQGWIADYLKSKFGLRNVYVSRPLFHFAEMVIDDKRPLNSKCIFSYPVVPREGKNLELIISVLEILPRSYHSKVEFNLTFDGSETEYSNNIARKLAGYDCINLIGYLTRKEMAILYAQTDVLIFPSFLETWGLPLSEFSIYRRPVLVSEFPYAHETLDGCVNVTFLPFDNPINWVDVIIALVDQTYICPLATKCGAVNSGTLSDVFDSIHRR